MIAGADHRDNGSPLADSVMREPAGLQPLRRVRPAAQPTHPLKDKQMALRVGMGGSLSAPSLAQLFVVRGARAPADHFPHMAGCAVLLELGLEQTMNLRIFVGIFDLRTAVLYAGIGRPFVADVIGPISVAVTTPTQCEVARRLVATVEMLMKPVRWRDHDAAR